MHPLVVPHRALLVRLLTVVAVAVLYGMPLSSGQTFNLKSDGIAGVQLITPNDSRFLEESASILAVSGLNEHIRGLQYSGVILKNTTDRPVVAYVLKWSVTPPGGAEIDYAKIFWDRTSRRGVLPGRQDAFSYVRHPIPPDSSRLVSPFFNLSKYSNVELYGEASVYAGPSDLEAALKNPGTAVLVKLDTVIYADGQVEGPDVFGLADRINGEMTGIRSLDDQVRQARSSGTSIKPVLEQLAQGATHTISASFPPPNSSQDTWAQYWRRTFAAQLLRIAFKADENTAFNKLSQEDTSFAPHRSQSGGAQ